MWSRLDRFKFKNFNLKKSDSEERDITSYYRTLYDLAQVLPVAGNKILLDKVIMPLLEEQLIAIAQGGVHDDMQLLAESTIQAMKSMTIAPGGIFRYLLNLLKTAKRQFSSLRQPLLDLVTKVLFFLRMVLDLRLCLLRKY